MGYPVNSKTYTPFSKGAFFMVNGGFQPPLLLRLTRINRASNRCFWKIEGGMGFLDSFMAALCTMLCGLVLKRRCT